MEPTTPEIIQAFLETEATIETLHRQLQALSQIQSERSLKIRSQIQKFDGSFAVEIDGELYLTKFNFDGDLVISPLPKIN